MWRRSISTAVAAIALVWASSACQKTNEPAEVAELTEVTEAAEATAQVAVTEPAEVEIRLVDGEECGHCEVDGFVWDRDGADFPLREPEWVSRVEVCLADDCLVIPDVWTFSRMQAPAVFSNAFVAGYLQDVESGRPVNSVFVYDVVEQSLDTVGLRMGRMPPSDQLISVDPSGRYLAYTTMEGVEIRSVTTSPSCFPTLSSYEGSPALPDASRERGICPAAVDSVATEFYLPDADFGVLKTAGFKWQADTLFVALVAYNYDPMFDDPPADTVFRHAGYLTGAGRDRDR